MRIKSLTLKNYRCFSENPTRIDLKEFSVMIGTNGSGKTALLSALGKLFGTNPADRGLVRDDFHIPRNVKPESINQTELFIEVEIEFPELGEGGDPSTVPDFFNHMIIEKAGSFPYCRIRLEGKYVKSGLPQGEVEERIYWVTSTEPNITDQDKQRFTPQDRSRINVVYVPASRDPSRQLKSASGTHLSRLLGSVKWSDAPKTVLGTATKSIQDTLRAEAGVEAIHKSVSSNWNGLHDQGVYAQPKLQFMDADIETIISKAEMVFFPSVDGAEHEVDRLSDGQKSLLYFALVSSIFDIESALLNPEDANKTSSVIDVESFKPALLRVFAVEEPENHLAPHFLSRIIDLLGKISGTANSQVIVTSHSPSIMARVEPEQVRHFIIDSVSGAVAVRPIDLPKDDDDAYKYVKEAVKAFPELYFSKFVILGEGDSEQVVLPRVAKAMKTPLDPGFVSVVPLGGRHVNHFWRLLNSLGIPYVTLLDFDLEREGGGWGRIKYVCNQLLELGYLPANVLSFTNNNTRYSITPDQLKDLHLARPDNNLDLWIAHLNSFGVYFSSPVDLDFLMLGHYQAFYKKISPPATGPHIPKDPVKYREKIDKAMSATLREAFDPSLYSPENQELFIWYNYLFLGKGKPLTHCKTISEMTDEEIASSVPWVLSHIISLARSKIQAG